MSLDRSTAYTSVQDEPNRNPFLELILNKILNCPSAKNIELSPTLVTLIKNYIRENKIPPTLNTIIETYFCAYCEETIGTFRLECVHRFCNDCAEIESPDGKCFICEKYSPEFERTNE